MVKHLTFLVLFSLFFSGCHYKLGRGEIDTYRSFSLPCVEGDREGLLTSFLVEELSARSSLRYNPVGGDLSIQVTLLEPGWETIGFTFAPREEVDDKEVVVSNEGRLAQAALITLLDRKKKVTLWGPLEVVAFIDYDYESDFSNVNFHAFSLGQLEMDPQARDAARYSLYRLLSKKIVDYLLNSW